MQVLIVDDDIDIREALVQTLAMEGHHPIAVADGLEALRYLRSGNSVCLILLDLMMPVMNGWEFRAEQQRDESISSIPIVVITADGNAKAKAEQLSASAFLRKPMDTGDLLTVVDQFCPKPN
jgi:CheY-like chemotaxis protein